MGAAPQLEKPRTVVPSEWFPVTDDDRIRRAYGVDENAAGLLDLGDEANPDLETLSAKELSDEELLWVLLRRAQRREAPKKGG